MSEKSRVLGTNFRHKGVNYETYKSPYGPNYKTVTNFKGISLPTAMRFATTVGAFGVVAGVFAIQFMSDVPKVRTDIVQKIPYIGDFFHREVAPEDNPF